MIKLNLFKFRNLKFFCNRNTLLKREDRIKEKLKLDFEPEHLEVINESYKHSVPKDAETHFKVIIVSNKFQNKSTVAVHQSIYKLLKDEMGEKIDNKLHALSLVTKTPEEWKKLNNITFNTPNCMNNKKS